MADEAEREVEDFFNEQIFGVNTAVEPPPLMPESPPESKPVDEVLIDAPADEVEEGTAEEPEEAPDSEETPLEQGEVEVEEGTEEAGEEEYVAWAKKQYGDDLDLASPSSQLLARAAYEKEKLLGSKAQEEKELRKQIEERELQSRIDALNTPGALTEEEDTWVTEAVTASDPGEWAYNALQAERPDLYAAVMDRWASQGEQESRAARVLHSRVLQAISLPQPSEQETYSAALGQTFQSLGLSIEEHGPLILTKAEELGNQHPAVVGMMSQDPDVRRIAARAVYDLAVAAKTSVSKARTDDVVEARVKEEQLRQQAAGVNQGGPRVEQPKRSPFWEQFDQELSDRGWDGNRPVYGRESPRLSPRERQVLLAYANGMRSSAVERAMLLTSQQVQHLRRKIRRKLRVNGMPEAVAVAWRLCLIDGDQIEGGPIPPEQINESSVQEMCSAYLQQIRHQPPPVESWKQLRRRARRIAKEYDLGQPRHRSERHGPGAYPKEPHSAALPMETSR